MARLDIFDRALHHALLWETGGDLIDGAPHEVPGDAGGFTKWGIAQARWPDVDVPNLTYEDAELFYLEKFWHGPRVGELPADLSVQVFDWGVNAGVPRAARALQRQLGGLRVDGLIGHRTLKRAGEVNPYNVTLHLGYRRRDFYHKLVALRPSQAKFLRGWERRTMSTLALAMCIGVEEA